MFCSRHPTLGYELHFPVFHFRLAASLAPSRTLDRSPCSPVIPHRTIETPLLLLGADRQLPLLKSPSNLLLPLCSAYYASAHPDWRIEVLLLTDSHLDCRYFSASNPADCVNFVLDTLHSRRLLLWLDAQVWDPTTKIRLFTVTRNQKCRCRAISSPSTL